MVEAASGFVTRFAPSPTGRLHLGHAYSALTAFEAARVAGGRFLLRIEDTDFTRCRPEHEAAIHEELGWLGLRWEEPVRRQSEHRADHAAALERLQQMGVLYRCFRTRRELALLAPHADDAADPLAFAVGRPAAQEEAERLARGEPFAWRLSLAAAQALVGPFERLTWIEEGEGTGVGQARPERFGDVVLGRKDVGVAYHLAAVWDDALQGVTHVIRGVDLAEAASVHRVLQALLGLPTPIYRHHRLIAGPDGKRLAKRTGAETLSALRARGVSAGEVRAMLGFPLL